MTESNVLEELKNIVHHGPLFPGDTISHHTANECGARGWAERNESGDWVPTQSGMLAHQIAGCESCQAPK